MEDLSAFANWDNIISDSEVEDDTTMIRARHKSGTELLVMAADEDQFPEFSDQNLGPVIINLVDKIVFILNGNEVERRVRRSLDVFGDEFGEMLAGSVPIVKIIKKCLQDAEHYIEQNKHKH